MDDAALVLARVRNRVVVRRCEHLADVAVVDLESLLDLAEEAIRLRAENEALRKVRDAAVETLSNLENDNDCPIPGCTGWKRMNHSRLKEHE